MFLLIIYKTKLPCVLLVSDDQLGCGRKCPLEQRRATQHFCDVWSRSSFLPKLIKGRFRVFCPPGVAKPGRARARNWIQEHRLQLEFPGPCPGLSVRNLV